MKRIIAVATLQLFTGCVVTGGASYRDEGTGAKAFVGLSHEFKPKAKFKNDAKQIKPRE